MAITYIEALLEYLKDAPREWAQVIAARAAIRVLPYAFGQRVQSQWVSDYSISLFRATSISWAAVNFPIYDMRPASQAANFAAWGAGQSAVAVIFNDSAGYEYMQVAAQVAYAAAHASGTGYFDNYVNQASVAVNDAHTCSALFDTTAETDPIGWANINADCVWLAEQPASNDAALAMTGMKLWPAGKPEGWSEAWASASKLLATLDLGYGEWIDWYNRRIEGHKAAFDIPGDSDRTEDKKILARLADATNEDFWDKGATYVNTTLQGWIDEARERVRPRDAPFVTDPLRQLDAELQGLIDEAREQVATQGKESVPEPQNADVIQFRQTDTGQFDPDFSAGSDELLTDQAACDRHHALVATARDALSLCRGHNQIGHVAEHLTIVIDAAGDQPRTMRVDLLVARGERMVDDLRDAINELQSDPEVALGNLREKRIVNVFNALIRDYTAMIKLDPALDRRQRLPHYDEENASAVSPQQALIFVNSSVTVGAITQSARDVIVEGARGLTEDGDVKDRKKWRFSETVRNLPRAMIGFLWQHRGGIVGSSVAGVSAVSMALITQEAAIRSFFATNPGMLSIIDELVGILRGIGM